MRGQSLQERVSHHYPDLSPRLQRAADFVVTHPLDVATRSLRQIASASAVAPPTLSRLARALSCESYQELRDLCRLEVTRREISLAEKAEALGGLDEQQPGTRGAFLMAQARSSMSNITTLLETVDLSELADAADILASSRRVLLIGSMSGAAFMTYMNYVASIAADNWMLLDAASSTSAPALLSVNSKDSVLVLSHRPYSRQTVEAAKVAHQAGARVIAVTDAASSPLLPLAEKSFLVSADSPQFFPSHVATLVLLEAILGMVVRRQGKNAQQRIAAVETLNRALGEYYEA